MDLGYCFIIVLWSGAQSFRIVFQSYLLEYVTHIQADRFLLEQICKINHFGWKYWKNCNVSFTPVFLNMLHTQLFRFLHYVENLWNKRINYGLYELFLLKNCPCLKSCELFETIYDIWSHVLSQGMLMGSVRVKHF